MQIQQLRVKIAARTSEFDHQELIRIFHRWIREARLGEEMLIDVADYRHVPDGPGVMLIGHEGHYSFDELGRRPGLSYARKRDPVGDVRLRLQQGFGRAFAACHALASEPTLAGKLDFHAGELVVHVLSRLVGPNTAETWDAFRPHLTEFLTPLYPDGEISLEHLDDPREPFGVRVAVTGDPRVADVLARLNPN